MWDWRSGNCFQQGQTIAQPGSLESENGIYALAFDRSGSRLVTCEADKTIKMWKEDPNATEETHERWPRPLATTLRSSRFQMVRRSSSPPATTKALSGDQLTHNNPPK